MNSDGKAVNVKDMFERSHLLTDSKVYKLTHFSEEPKFYVLWMPNEVRECTVKAKKVFAEQLEYCWDEEENKFKGRVEERSATPELLNHFLANTKSTKYNEEKSFIKFNPENSNDLFALNELLSKPLFKV